ncbi:TonB-dependent receptor [Methylobacter sp. BlB1]|uniref:TonB-dependent receptor n=1 Tax=Methylobacter sp. BlB1 TaxID=2785914 RepID=UPI0018959A38|nr:TonB-dependent receptor [Methylobacter sp. BlB1]MBF6647226.1 TonB-dependent receptor [Methylobacter sp. BlB1]
MKKNLVYGAIGLFSLSSLSAVMAEEQSKVTLETIDVVGVTPLPGSGVEAAKIPANIQTVTSEQLEKAQSLSLNEYINRYLGSVHVNEAQNNPLQPDIYYRGFVASPLLGLPQGLSTYVNGVRFNEPFGDTVNWDLIPKGAIDTMALVPGSNPMYGLNTLGGAIALKTKTGFSAPGHQFEVYGGSWDRHSEELTSGANNGTWGYFLDVHNFGEQGWRDFSPTRAKQVLGTLSWQNDRGELDLTLAANDNDMKGNGAAPEQLLGLGRKAVFTHPDQTITRMFFSELSGSYDLTDDIEVSGNAYFRQNRIRTFNGDDSDFDGCADDSGFLCDESGEFPVVDINGNQVLEDDSVEGATNNTSATNMRSRGGTLQSMFKQDWFEHENNLTVGASYDYADVHFGSDTELAQLTDDRGTIGSGILVRDARVRLNTNTEIYGFYLSDTFSVTDDLAVTLAGRYNHVSITMANQFIDGEDKLSGKHSFERFNPSAGFTYQIIDNVGMYGSYSESSRAPTPMELSCADEDDPCRLPNAFVSDPPLDQVVAKTWEGGFRGNFDKFLEKGDMKWNLGYFHTVNHDDIIFNRGGDSISEGFFSNVGQTRRYGIEAGTTLNYAQLFSGIDDWHFAANYTYLNARFMDGFTIQSPLDEDEPAQVTRGNRIPGMPEHIFKASIGVDLWKRFSLGIDGLYSGDQFFRGDEANTTPKLAGYWLFNAKAEYKINKHLALFGKVDNIFDKDYASFGVYGQADEVLGDAFNSGRFVSPGAPRAGWIGVRLSM